MNYIIENEVVDTYGGDFTFKNMWWEEEDGKFYVYESYTGAKADDLNDDMWIKCFNSKEKLDEFISIC